MKLKTKNKMPAANERVWRQSGYLLADTLVVIWKFTARRNLSETPPERKAAGRCVQCADNRAAVRLSRK